MALQYLLITGCALLGALLVCWRRDFQMLIQLGMVFLLFMSGVFWDVQTIQNTELVKWLSICNPLLVLLNAYRDVLAEHGLRCTGISPDGTLVELIELPEHPWYIGCQFHPELKSRPMRPHPLFASFIAAAQQRARSQRGAEAGYAESHAS